jgi:putative isomerase
MADISRRQAMAAIAATGAAVAGAHSADAEAKSLTHRPGLATQDRQQFGDALLHFFGEKAPLLLRPAAGILKHPNVASSLPGNTYSTDLWDWDTLWTSRGLFRVAELRHDEGLRQKLCEHVSGSLLNFLEHASPEGQIPIMMTATDPDPFRMLGKGGTSRNQAKPVFGQLGLLAADQRKDVGWLAPHFDAILRFYDAWTKRNESHVGLLVWGDDVAIGDDNDPTTFCRPFFSSANLLLNCLFYEDLLASSELAKRLGRGTDQQKLASHAAELARNIETYCWDPRDSYYYTVDVQCADRRAELIPTVQRGMDTSWKCLPLRIQVFTGFLPLWCGIASHERAEEMVQVNYRADDRLNARWGLRSLSSREQMYSLAFSSNPSNWLGPVWTVVNHFAWKAFQRYGFAREAADLADKTIALLGADLKANGTLNEYYHPDTGAALSHKGFMDWNLLVLEMI